MRQPRRASRLPTEHTRGRVRAQPTLPTRQWTSQSASAVARPERHGRQKVPRTAGTEALVAVPPETPWARATLDEVA